MSKVGFLLEARRDASTKMVAHEDGMWALSASTYGATFFANEEKERCLTRPHRLWSDPPLSLLHTVDLSSSNNLNVYRIAVETHYALHTLPANRPNRAARPPDEHNQQDRPREEEYSLGDPRCWFKLNEQSHARL